MLAVVACGRPAPITSCDDDLRGVYAAGDERWMMLDHGAALEAYPLFPDGSGPAEVIAAPRWLALDRTPAATPASGAQVTGQPAGPSGTLHRRYMQRDASCNAQVPVQITRCAGDMLELVHADLVAPVDFESCTWTPAAPSRTVRWRRE